MSQSQLNPNYRITLSNKKKLAEIEPQIKSIDTEITGIISDVDTLTHTVNNIIGLKKSETGFPESRLQITSTSGTQPITVNLKTNIDNAMIVTLKGVCFTTDQRDVTQTLFVNNFNSVYLSAGGTGTNFYITNLKQHSSGYFKFDLAWTDFPINTLAGLHILGCDVYGL